MCKTVLGTMLESEIASIKIIPHVAFTFTNLLTFFGDASVYLLSNFFSFLRTFHCSILVLCQRMEEKVLCHMKMSLQSIF